MPIIKKKAAATAAASNKKKRTPAKKAPAAAAKKRTLKIEVVKPRRTRTVKKKIVEVFIPQPGQPPIIEEQSQERIEESKYYAGPVIQKFEGERHYEFPPGYGDNRIVLMVRDPYWLYTYWEVNEQRRREIAREVGEALFSQAREILRVHDTASWAHFDVNINSGAANWYLRVPEPNRSYCVDIGYLLPDGRFVIAARSNFVTTPLDRMSDVIDEQWMIPDWEKLYAISGGFGVGRGSEEVRELMKKRLEQGLSSGWISSLSSPIGLRPERPFWLVANCELIVYGATEPGSTVTVQGHKINLREDGTFTLRFALPDGKQTIPIEAIRDDGQERRKITPQVERQTD
ncbi:hypothetical protein A2311_06330 [candidate division WOR-1 bacterium RIFOXYB2_FULL_48_7]|uniref:DUF4912 domain-containing protein n=1 Tax=candidate division WOR-1 bacterium RIFOXYB2_FULL_48_7 TaxID=1802583 RepID=A0A1F4TVK8_UNCSA|nr:MAG: hypothetical protein A2311_06330 [candidate division WOR-1 bacterium RIFOXYB2_FULL_48_7]